MLFSGEEGGSREGIRENKTKTVKTGDPGDERGSKSREYSTSQAEPCQPNDRGGPGNMLHGRTMKQHVEKSRLLYTVSPNHRKAGSGS